MCRNIKMLFNFEPPVTDEEIRAASLQFVRKISGFNKPSKANEGSFMAAIDEIAGIVELDFFVRSRRMRRRGVAKKRLQRPKLAPRKDSVPDRGMLPWEVPTIWRSNPAHQSSCWSHVSAAILALFVLDRGWRWDACSAAPS